MVSSAVAGQHQITPSQQAENNEAVAALIRDDDYNIIPAQQAADNSRSIGKFLFTFTAVSMSARMSKITNDGLNRSSHYELALAVCCRRARSNAEPTRPIRHSAELRSRRSNS